MTNRAFSCHAAVVCILGRPRGTDKAADLKYHNIGFKVA